METSVRAIVLRRRDAGENDRRLTVLTRELGKIEVLAKGARKSGSRLAGISDPLTESIMNLAVGRHQRFVTQAQPLRSFRALRNDYIRLTAGLCLVELYATTLPGDQPDEAVFDLLNVSLGYLESHPRPLAVLAWSMVALLNEHGVLPVFDRCVLTDADPGRGEAWLSPMAGGVVDPAGTRPHPDAFPVRGEVRIGLERLGELGAPPPNLKHAEETLRSLVPFFRELGGVALPATEAFCAQLGAPAGSGDPGL